MKKRNYVHLFIVSFFFLIYFNVFFFYCSVSYITYSKCYKKKGVVKSLFYLFMLLFLVFFLQRVLNFYL